MGAVAGAVVDDEGRGEQALYPGGEAQPVMASGARRERLPPSVQVVAAASISKLVSVKVTGAHFEHRLVAQGINDNDRLDEADGTDFARGEQDRLGREGCGACGRYGSGGRRRRGSWRRGCDRSRAWAMAWVWAVGDGVGVGVGTRVAVGVGVGVRVGVAVGVGVGVGVGEGDGVGVGEGDGVGDGVGVGVGDETGKAAASTAISAVPHPVAWS